MICEYCGHKFSSGERVGKLTDGETLGEVYLCMKCSLSVEVEEYLRWLN